MRKGEGVFWFVLGVFRISGCASDVFRVMSFGWLSGVEGLFRVCQVGRVLVVWGLGGLGS